MDKGKGASSVSPKHIVFSAGGNHAAIGGLAAICAMYLVEYDLHLQGKRFQFESCGGASGGATPAALLAARQSPSKMMHLAIDTDLPHYLRRRGVAWTVGGVIRKLLTTAPWKLVEEGLIDSTGYGELVASQTETEWPARFWAVASHKGAPVLFTRAGSYVVEHGAGKPGLADLTLKAVGARPSLPDAICATIAIPALLESPRLLGMQMFDGSMTPFGRDPDYIPRIAFGATGSEVVSFNFGGGRTANLALTLGRLLTGGGLRMERCSSGYRKTVASDGGTVINMPNVKVGSLNFNITRKQKQEMFLLYFRYVSQALTGAGHLSAHTCVGALTQSQNWSDFEALMRAIELEAPRPFR